MREYFEDVPWRKVAIAAPVFLVIVGALSYFFLVPEDNTEEILPEDVRIEVSAEDFVDMRPVVVNSLEGASNFGYNIVDIVKANSFVEVNKTIANSPNAVDPTMYKSREVAYNKLRENLIAKGSPIDYSVSTSASWPSSIEFSSNKRYFSVDNINVEKPDFMRKMDFNGTMVDTVKIDATLNGTVTIGKKTAFDSSWDGTYSIQERVFPDEKVKVQLVKIDGEWKLYNLEVPGNKFLFSTWKIPEEGIYAQELNTEYEEVEVLKVDETSGSENASADNSSANGNS